jgi:non-ribosomal peptide synthetase component F
LIFGGEALSWEMVQRIARMKQTCRVINHYGPTETTVGSLTYSVAANEVPPYSLTVPIGRPIANTRVFVLDKYLQPVPTGVAGELYIGGAGVAAGYLNQPAETAARFVADPFALETGARLYRTGDLARYLPDGNIEFLGRVDHQVKVRGFRVELGEIETVLASHATVRQAVVTTSTAVSPAASLAKEESATSQRLIAYIVTTEAKPPATDELRNLLKQKLPDYMVPSAFVFLKSLPLTPNGKIDRAALPAPDETRPDLQRIFVAPRTPVEAELARIWAGLLKVNEVGVDDNFFDLGGHSLLATQVVSRMRQTFQVEISLRSLFELPTVAALAEKISNATADETARLLAELEQLSDEEAELLLKLEQPPLDTKG